MSKESITHCAKHDRERTGFTTLFCPDCDKEKDALTVMKNMEKWLDTRTVITGPTTLPPIARPIWDVLGVIENISYPTPSGTYIVQVGLSPPRAYPRARVRINRFTVELEGSYSVIGKTFACNALPTATTGPYESWEVGPMDAILIV